MNVLQTLLDWLRVFKPVSMFNSLELSALRLTMIKEKSPSLTSFHTSRLSTKNPNQAPRFDCFFVSPRRYRSKPDLSLQNVWV